MHHAACSWRYHTEPFSCRDGYSVSYLPSTTLLHYDHLVAEVSASWHAGASSEGAHLDDGPPVFSCCFWFRCLVVVVVVSDG